MEAIGKVCSATASFVPEQPERKETRRTRRSREKSQIREKFAINWDLTNA
jgi:hypothetical protein